MVEIDARLDIQPEVKTSAAGLPCRSASSASSSTIGLWVPEMLRVPPAPAPWAQTALDRGFDDVGMAAHAEIVVRAPDRHFAWAVFLALGAPLGDREPARVTLEIGEGAVPPFRLQTRNRLLEAPLIVHRLSFSA